MHLICRLCLRTMGHMGSSRAILRVAEYLAAKADQAEVRDPEGGHNKGLSQFVDEDLPARPGTVQARRVIAGRSSRAAQSIVIALRRLLVPGKQAAAQPFYRFDCTDPDEADLDYAREHAGR